MPSRTLDGIRNALCKSAVGTRGDECGLAFQKVRLPRALGARQNGRQGQRQPQRLDDFSGGFVRTHSQKEITHCRNPYFVSSSADVNADNTRLPLCVIS
ncbi:MAG: hypothetical protein BWY09_01058 [Candidatus Hydrogenedentes bacterium ADurb.Bin179]|nr:MAG: hypothetical protein BWY09_01058 [Candidatus Hydrogenedentes bacterium ADurb.Bin179]